MTSVDTATMEAVHKLLDERHKYEGWLTALQARKEVTPEHIFQRVNADYSSRLSTVTQQLASYADQIKAALEQLTEKLADLVNQEAECSDERDEAELRSIVGEYTAEEWESVKETTEQQLASLKEERERVSAEVSELQKIVDTSQNGASSKPNATTQQNVAAAAAAIESTALITDEDTSDNNVAVVADASQEAYYGDSTLDSIPSQAGFGFDSELPSSSTAKTAVSASPVSSSPSGTNSAVVASGDSVMKGNTAESAVAPSLFNSPSAGGAASNVNADTRRESEKTLKCPECSASNYATEWYCERCGGELATF